MCSGKSTLGRAVAEITGVPFVDLDQAVERRVGMSVREIFDTQGEAAFRFLERQLLSEICREGAPTIVACGGGLPCQPGAMDEMRSCGLTVWLQPSADRLIDRLMEGRAKRPLLAGISTRSDMQAFAKKMLAERTPFYAQAQTQFDSSLLETEEEIAATARRFAEEMRLPVGRTAHASMQTTSSKI